MKFPKRERLHTHKEVSELFKSGHFLYSDCFKFIYTISSDADTGIRIGISIPKKHIKHAVQRNLIKRRTTESIRQKKHSVSHLCIENGINLTAFFIYKKNYPESFKTIGKSIDTIIEKTIKVIHADIEKSNARTEPEQ